MFLQLNWLWDSTPSLYTAHSHRRGFPQSKDQAVQTTGPSVSPPLWIWHKYWPCSCYSDAQPCPGSGSPVFCQQIPPPTQYCSRLTGQSGKMSHPSQLLMLLPSLSLFGENRSAVVISSRLQRAESSFWPWVSAQINYFIYSSKQTFETQKG